MCGFAGFCDTMITDGEVKRYIIRQMTEKIAHRGPDDMGIFSDGNIALGFARLKIIDLVGGAQPMYSADGRYVLCFNGEIYNYKELAEEQRHDFGEKFRTSSDTEVLMSVLVHYGERGLERLRGMYSFAFYDRKENTLLLARDPFGIKPLYYGFFDGTFIFASEIKAFLVHPHFKKKLNTEILPYYLQFQYVPTEQTAFDGVMRLPAGCLLKFSGGKLKKERYFELPQFYKNGYKGFSFFAERDGDKREVLPYKKNLKKTADILGKVLQASVKRHTQSDVKVGAFLSGGVDSGLIAALARPEKAFTVGFKRADFDERAHAHQSAQRLGISLSSFEVDADDFFDVMEDVQYHSDEPYANLSAIPLYLLAREARKEVGVVLSGEGADELFGGYDWYADSGVGRGYRRLPEKLRRVAASRALEGRIGEFLRRNKGDAERDFIGQAHIMTASEAYSLLAKPYKVLKDSANITEEIYWQVNDAHALRKKMYLDMNLWLPFDILNKADKMTMASSLELRVPYLDLAVLSVAQGCAKGLLMHKKVGKYILRSYAQDMLGEQAAFRAKKGFPVPFRAWIREKKYAEILKTSFTGAIGREFFDTDMLMQMLDEHIKGTKNNARKLYTVYAFIVWYEVYFEKEAFTNAVIDTKEETIAPATEKKRI